MQYRKRAAERISLDGSEILRELNLSRGGAGSGVQGSGPLQPRPERLMRFMHIRCVFWGWGAGWGDEAVVY